MDLPTAPRAMQRENGPNSSRSLLDRMGPSRHAPHVHDEIQARIDNITGPSTPDMMMMPAGPAFPMNGMPGMDMGAMGGMNNPIMIQEMMLNQMALMAQMAGAMGILNPAAMGMNGQFPGQPGMSGDMVMMNGGINGMPHQGNDIRGRGRGRGGSRGVGGRGRGGYTSGPNNLASETPVTGTHASSTAAPVPSPAAAAPTSAQTAALVTRSAPVSAPQITPSSSQGRIAVSVPERPQSPTLCKFGPKCTNPTCRYSHPSPVATPESGLVLSNEACEKGKDCKDKDCIKAHVSPAVLKPACKCCSVVSKVDSTNIDVAEQLNPKAQTFTPAAHVPYHTKTTRCCTWSRRM